jgi:uncharacterized protein (TIGR02217 family)
MSVVATYPTIRGLTFPLVRVPEWSNVIQRVTSGKEIRFALWTSPIWHWVLDYEYLKDDPNDLLGLNPDTDLKTLLGFYLQMQGGFTPFYFDDPTDDNVDGQIFGTGDGTTLSFPLVRTLGGFTEPIQSPDPSNPPQIYDNGVLCTPVTQYNIDSVGNVNFGVAPVAGHTLTVTMNYFWLVRFEEDKMDFERFMAQLYTLKQVKLIYVKQ